MNMEQLNEQIKSNDALLVYFSGEYCGVCQTLKPKIFDTFFLTYPKIKQLEIKTDENIELTRQLGVFALPTIIIYFDGAEFIKKERNISVDGLIDEVKRPYSLFFEE
jgi:thioredoxin-like negative regulator of GroEL